MAGALIESVGPALAQAARAPIVDSKARVAWSRFKGAWFEVQVPPGFHVRPSLKSATGQGYDSVFFSSPDGLVEFYVFCPQWKGNPSDAAIGRGESVIAVKSSKAGDRKTTWTTVSSALGKYQRSLEDIQDDRSRRILGIKYRSLGAYKRYKADYLRFKRSLVALGD